MIEQVGKLKTGSVLSESSHYIVEEILAGTARVKHFESGDSVNISVSYLKNFTCSGDIYDTTVEVTKEDKKDGSLGIRSIWENIHSAQVFTVCFKKQDKPKSKKQYEAEINERAEAFAAAIDRVKAQKKGVANAAKSLVEELSKNPILPYTEGEERILRGYKIQFASRDGKYDCVDMDIERTEKESGIRPVNINTIKWLIIGGTKYVVK